MGTARARSGWWRGGLCLLLAAALLSSGAWLALDRPPGFAIEQSANHYYRKGSGVRHDIASWLIEIGIVRDWAAPAEPAEPPPPYPLLLSAASALHSYPYQTYSGAGQPDSARPGAFMPPAGSRSVAVDTAAELRAAIDRAQPGDIITIAPGTYDIADHAITVRVAGNPDQPIYLRAETFGTVLLRLDSLEGFHVLAPYWVFENLRIEGACASDSACEHAFHVVGKGKSFTLRNSEVFNFNAHVKVNLQPVDGADYYPDDGLVEYNSFYNEAPRITDNPVTLLNIDAADRWRVRGNFIADFAKRGSDHVSYGAFMKGNSRGGVFERNLVMCEYRIPADHGVRVGLSFGGGGTAARYCRDQACEREYREGTMVNNIVMNCSRDVAIYLNRAADSQVHHNLLYNTLGIDVRFEESSADIRNNIISGRIRNRDGGHSNAASNLVVRDCLGRSRGECLLSRIYRAPDRADFRLMSLDNPVWRPLAAHPGLGEDFCGLPVPADINTGPIQYINGLDCLNL